MIKIPNITPHFYGYDNYPRDDDGKILLDRAEDGKIIIKRRNTINIGNKGLIALCDGAKIAKTDWEDLRRGFYLEEKDGTRKFYFLVGGSDAGAIYGVSPYSTALDVFYAKTRSFLKEYDESTLYRFDYGHINEPLVAQGFAIRTKMTGEDSDDWSRPIVVKNDAVFFNERSGFLMANVDYFVRHPDGQLSILEIKTTDVNSPVYALAKEGKVPLTYYTQAVLHYPMVLSDGFNIKDTYFAVAAGNNIEGIQFCHFGRELEGERKLFEAEKLFVDSLINNTPPADTATPEQQLEKSGLKHAISKPIAVELSDTAIAAVSELLSVSEEKERVSEMLKGISKRESELQSLICKDLGDAECSTPFCINGVRFSAHWKSNVRETLNKDVVKAHAPELYDRAVKKTVQRRFSIKKEE